MKDHKNFIKNFTSYYFLTPPIQFVRGHFPNEKKWQLLPKKEMVDQKKFMEFVDLKSNFYDLAGVNDKNYDVSAETTFNKGKINK